jgi:RNA polymerase sigma factor (sigma-70 family)
MKETNENADERCPQFEQRWPKYNKRLRRYIFRLTDNEADADDITQETFIRCQPHMAGKQGDVEVKCEYAYLKTTARNLVKDLWRHRKQEGLVSYDNEQDEQTLRDLDLIAMRGNDFRVGIEDGLSYKKLYQALPLKTILVDITEEALNLVYLKVVEKMSPKEIARELDMDHSYVAFEVNRTMATIRARAKKLVKDKGNAVDGRLL